MIGSLGSRVLLDCTTKEPQHLICWANKSTIISAGCLLATNTAKFSPKGGLEPVYSTYKCERANN